MDMVLVVEVEKVVEAGQATVLRRAVERLGTCVM